LENNRLLFVQEHVLWSTAASPKLSPVRQLFGFEATAKRGWLVHDQQIKLARKAGVLKKTLLEQSQGNRSD
jgi:hypothetical protein